MKNLINTIALASVGIIFAGSAHAQTNGQNFYTPNANPPASPGLTNPSGSTVYTPNSPPHPLGGTPQMPNTANTNINVNHGITPDNATGSMPNINANGTGVGAGTGTGSGASGGAGVR